MKRFEKEYEDVLQNIEFGIVSVAREAADATDYEVQKALNALIREYQKGMRAEGLTPIAQAMADRVREILAWRNTADVPDIRRVTNAEIVLCLKRIRKSVQRWSREGGRTGYLDFIDQFIQ